MSNKQVKKPGGPMLFIKNALKDLGTDYEPFFGKTINVEIRVKKDGEIGRITTIPEIQIIPDNPPSSFVVVSTVFNEWNISKLNLLKNKVFVDIQGYVRDGRKLGKKVMWESVEDYAGKIFCLKGTKEEMLYLPKNVYEDQKKRLLIITDGEKGVEWFYKGQRHFIAVERVVRSKDTIGVGDTFFGYLVGYVYSGKAIGISIKCAIKKTELFLESKK